jgi:hypothetical protein
VVGWQPRDDSFRANGSITLPEGSKLFLGSPNETNPGAADK